MEDFDFMNTKHGKSDGINVYRLDFAHIPCKNSILISGGDAHETTVIGCFAYLVKSGSEYILIDCGIEDINTVNLTKSSKDDWVRSKGEYDILGNLRVLGVSPDDITRVYLTHCHYDHISGITHLKNARIYMTAKEYEYMQSDINAHKKFTADAIEFIESKKSDGMLVLLKDCSKDNDVQCTLVGGHTPGSMLVTVGNVMFTGDAVFLLDNIKKNLPIGFCADSRGAKSVLDLCRAHNGMILTGHDMKCPKTI